MATQNVYENKNEMYHIIGCYSSSLSKRDLGPYISKHTYQNNFNS